MKFVGGNKAWPANRRKAEKAGENANRKIPFRYTLGP